MACARTRNAHRRCRVRLAAPGPGWRGRGGGRISHHPALPGSLLRDGRARHGVSPEPQGQPARIVVQVVGGRQDGPVRSETGHGFGVKRQGRCRIDSKYVWHERRQPAGRRRRACGPAQASPAPEAVLAQGRWTRWSTEKPALSGTRESAGSSAEPPCDLVHLLSQLHAQSQVGCQRPPSAALCSASANSAGSAAASGRRSTGTSSPAASSHR